MRKRVIGNVIASDFSENLPDYLQLRESIDQVGSTLPLLIVGWKEAKALFPDKFDITTKVISPGILWTHHPRQSRVDFEKDLPLFEEYCLKELEKKAAYRYLDPFMYKVCSIEALSGFLEAFPGRCSYRNGDMLYLVDRSGVFGLWPEIFKIFSISEEEIPLLLKKYGYITYNIEKDASGIFSPVIIAYLDNCNVQDQRTEPAELCAQTVR